MSRIRTRKTVNVNRVVIALVAITLMMTLGPGLPKEARADKGAAFLGGMVAGHVIGGAVRRSQVRTAAAVQQANQPRTVVQQTAPAPAPAAASSPQQKLDQLDKMAAGGYITPEEYKAKKKAILDAM
jgi:hypothetical protein